MKAKGMAAWGAWEPTVSLGAAQQAHVDGVWGIQLQRRLEDQARCFTTSLHHIHVQSMRRRKTNKQTKTHCNELICLRNYSVLNVMQTSCPCDKHHTAMPPVLRHFLCPLLPPRTAEATQDSPGDPGFAVLHYFLKPLALEIQERSRKASHESISISY